MDTIVAVATPPGRSAIGVIRLSGPNSAAILRTLVREPDLSVEPNRVVLKKISIGDSNQVLDFALISYFQAPHSFTGEDMVEISCHGSPVILRQLLDFILTLDARLAGPGEFTLRACRNGKLNLSQAEAIRDLINAKTSAAAQQAGRQLKGELSKALQAPKQELIQVIVRLESALEFVEDDLPAIKIKETLDQLSGVIQIVRDLAATYSTGYLIREGIRVTFVGRPNVGKSSLFNQLVRFDRAIVTELPGTTRDSLCESVSLGGVPVLLTDTAGLREAGDLIEAIGLERTEQAMADADVLVVVIDGSSDLSAEDHVVLKRTGHLNHIVAINKSDLPPAPGVKDELRSESAVVHLSALTGAGLDQLTAAILGRFGSVDSEHVGLLITNSRHYDLLRRAEASLEEARQLLSEHTSEDMVLVGLHSSLKFLGEITGETTTDDILGQIFSTFCIGK